MVTRRAVLAAGVGFAAPAYADVAWRTLGPGLEHATAPIESTIGDRRLDVVRIDPAFNRFVLLLAGALGSAPRTARQWANEHGLVAATNAGMFRANRLPVGFAKVQGRVIQPAMSADRSVFVFGADEARLLDTACDTFDESAHENALQSIRMISCQGRNVWSQQPRMWSTACVAQDGDGKILFLHARSPLSVHDLADAVRALPLGIARAMYMEGGPEATLVARAAGGEVIERYGSYETGFNENDDNAQAWPLPNILGVVPR
ncbi:MAG: phosphodiester glycosidase family protein [Hyphomonadaceae bacterium]